MTVSKLFVLISASIFLSGCFHTGEEAWQGWRRPEAAPTAGPTQSIEEMELEVKTEVEAQLDSDLRQIDDELKAVEQELNEAATGGQ